jgi:hypothetical protein
VRSMEDMERAAAASLQQRIKNKDDVPLVETSPWIPRRRRPISSTWRPRYSFASSERSSIGEATRTSP